LFLERGAIAGSFFLGRFEFLELKERSRRPCIQRVGGGPKFANGGGVKPVEKIKKIHRRFGLLDPARVGLMIK